MLKREHTVMLKLKKEQNKELAMNFFLLIIYLEMAEKELLKKLKETLKKI